MVIVHSSGVGQGHTVGNGGAGGAGAGRVTRVLRGRTRTRAMVGHEKPRICMTYRLQKQPLRHLVGLLELALLEVSPGGLEIRLEDLSGRTHLSRRGRWGSRLTSSVEGSHGVRIRCRCWSRC